MKSIESPTRSEPRLGYLSGAPRVTTRSASDAAGPRAHVLGVIDGFERRGWTVSRYIVGDRMPEVVARDGESMLHRGRAWTLAADIARLGLRGRHTSGAWSELGTHVDWVYERFALFQSLGSRFVRHGVPWILETNALLTEEASRERSGVVLTGLARRLERQAYEECTALIAISQALADRLVADMGVPREKIAVIPNGVDVHRFDPARVNTPRAARAFTVLFVGSLASWQGLDVLLRASAQVPDVQVTIAGDGPDRAALVALAQQLQIAPRFLGRVSPDDVPALIASADVCYSGHSAFRSPLKLYEYMAMGRPVISSAVPDAKAALVDGQTGFLFAPGDVDDLVRALRTAVSARECLDVMGQRARHDAVAHHSWDARVAAICAHVEALT
ncbi:MAG TPA: glycosyltransferase [Gemmatimonadaceae bacterium]|nr:glycosyltransferase [Gemmatimonadaceae bacterium]